MARGFVWRLTAMIAVASAVLLWPSAGQAVNGCDVPIVGGVYQVSTAAHVQDLHNCSLDGDFVQTADIVMPAPTTSGGVTSNFTPFGDSVDHFTGSYDGRDYTIRGLHYEDSSRVALGLFGVLYLASVSHLHLADVVIAGRRNGVAGLAGWLINTEVHDVSVAGRITGPAYVGGVAGYAGAGPDARDFQLTNVRFVGSVEGDADAVGGVIGGLEVAGSSASDNVLAGITRISARGEVRGGDGVGGLIGAAGLGPLDAQSRLHISEAVAFNRVEGRDSVGGAVGSLSLSTSDGRIVMADVYAAGTTTGRSNVGGLLGGSVITNPSAGSIDLGLVYARGAVRATGVNAGGLVGVRLDNDPVYTTVTAGFWNATAAGVSVSDGGTESTQAAMRTLGLYRDAGWAIVDQWVAPAADRVWGICASVNDGYPFLLWEYAENPCVKPAAPTGVTVQPRDRSALVSFAEPAAGDAPITGYEYSVDDGASWSGFETARSVGPLRITGLRNGTAYQVRVRARNANGAGPASTAVRVVPGTRQFGLSKPRRSSPYEVVVRMRVEGPGVASIVGTRAAGDRRRSRAPVCRQVLRPKKAGTVVLRCRVNAATRVALRDGAVPVRLRIAYQPVGGSARVVTRSLRLPAYMPTPRPVTG